MAKIRVTAPTEPFPIRGVIIWPLAYDLALYPYLATWLLCTGAGGTPNYVGHHLRGALNDAVVGNVIGIDTHVHADTAVAAAAGGHTPGINGVGDHSHTIDDDGNHTHPVTVYACDDPVDVEGCSPVLCVQVARYDHTHSGLAQTRGCHNHTGTTGDDGAHTHVMDPVADHTHVITVTGVPGPNIPLTRLCHFIQYTG